MQQHYIKHFQRTSKRKGEQAISPIYGHKQHLYVNDFKFYLFGSFTTDPSRLPPCQDAVYKHIMRSNYQAAIWRRILLAPHGHGWRVKVNIISIDWMNNTPAPKPVLMCLSCKCKSCKDKRCTCCRISLNCTSVCGCKSLCDNAIQVDAANVIQDSEDDSDVEKCTICHITTNTLF